MIWAIIIFGLLILVHEAGHFAAARWAGITVLEFSIGMGPALWSTERGGTRYSLRLLPIGASSDNRSAYLTHLAESYIALAESKLTTNQVEQHLHLTTLPEFTIERV